MSEEDGLLRILNELAKICKPLVDAANEDPTGGGIIKLVKKLGWDVMGLLPSGFVSAVQSAYATFEGDLGDPTKIIELLDGIGAFVELITSLDLGSQSFEGIGKRLLDYLIISYIQSEYPTIHCLLVLLGIIQVERRQAEPPMVEHVAWIIEWDNIPRLFSNPREIFVNTYDWGSSPPTFAAYQLLRNIRNILWFAGIDAGLQIYDPEGARTIDAQGTPEDPLFRVSLLYAQDGDNLSEIGGVLLPLRTQDQSNFEGLAMIPYGNLSRSFVLENEWTVSLSATMSAEGTYGLRLLSSGVLELGPINNAQAPSGIGISVQVTKSSELGRKTILLGRPDESRLEALAFGLKVGAEVGLQTRSELFGELFFEDAGLSIKPGEGDGFLQQILPAEGIEAPFELIVGWSTLDGVYFKGSSGLEVRLPIHVNLGPVDITALYLSLGIGSSNDFILGIATSVSAKLGPIHAAIDQIGFNTNIAHVDSGGNLGPVDLSFSFRPPEGVGLAIAPYGGGFLSFDYENERYAGMLFLQFGQVAIKAIGLITTRLPGGESGYSLLIIISGEFTPIQLGLGFTLNGVGGLLGLNRTMKVDRIREGLKTNTIDTMLFPNIEAIMEDPGGFISDLREIFPPEADRFVFGPMVLIGWGTPSIIQVKAGLLIEVPSPVRIALLGVVKAILPDEESRILALQVNFLGELNFEKKELAFDASLYDSKLLSFPLSGDMALRLNWGENPLFLLSVGGFHPAFKPPANLRKLERLTLQLTKGNNPRVRLETYFAVTSNTVQFGSRAELYAKKGCFNVNGFIGFDVLFRFNPFYFIAEYAASLALRKRTSEIAGIHISGALEGPTPWKVRGKAKLKILFIKIKIKFKKTFGRRDNRTFPDVAVLPLLRGALQDKSNWRSEIPPNLNNLVTIKDLTQLSTNNILVHPIGILIVSQTVVPLDITIQKFGNAKPSDANKFQITEVRDLGTDEVIETNDTFEKFAPAQFQEMTDAQRLSSKSFEDLKGGKSACWSELESSYVVTREVVYERIIIDSNGIRRIFDTVKEFVSRFTSLLFGNAAAKSVLSSSSRAALSLGPPKVSMSQEGYGVVNKSNLKPVSNVALVNSQAEARDYLAELIARNPTLAGEIQVVPASEVNQ